jgi:hypothetical protein
MERKLAFLFATVFCTSAFCQDVQVLLSLENGKTTYRSGEPIRLVLSFTALRGNYMLNTVAGKPMSPLDEIAITPETGVNHWLDDYSGGHRFQSDGFGVTNLSVTPLPVVLVLNDCLRIDGPATYTVRITTHRVLPGPMGAADLKPVPPLTTNAVSFTVTPMTDDEERAEMQRLTAARRLPPGINRNDRVAMQEADARQKRADDALLYLSGDVSTREKLRQFLEARGYLLNIEYALFMARNRELVLDTLEKALRDPNVPPSGTLFHAVVRLQELAPKPGLTVDVQQVWVAELIASLPQRTAGARAATLGTILQNLPEDRAQASKILVGLRDAPITEFANGYPLTMLVEYWDLFRDPRLVSGLEGMIRRYVKASGDFSGWLALQRLMELAPDRARPFVVAEVIKPLRSNDFERTLGILSGLRDTPLPEVDAPLLAAIREQATLERRTFEVLAQKGVLAARLATDAIYDPLLAIYQTESARWQPEERAGVLSYLARVHEPETMPIIERELSAFGFGPDQDYQAYMFLNSLTQGYYSVRIRALLAKRLEDDDARVVESVAPMMGKRGGAEDRALLEKRLQRWRDKWSGRESLASGNEGRLEMELVSALTSATAWKFSSAELESLRQGCLTELCRRSMPQQ